MRQLQPVIWSKGTFLTPQHLQTRDRYVESCLQFRLEGLNFRPWGFLELVINQEALAEGNFALTKATGLLADGLPFEVPESDAAPPPKPLALFFEADQTSLDVYLAIPEIKPHGLNVSIAQKNADVRYLSEIVNLRDENSGLAEKPVQIARKNFRFLVEGESREGFSSLQVARIQKTSAGTFRLDPQYVPPLLDVSASDYLMGIARRLVEILAAKSSILAGSRRQRSAGLADFSQADIASFWLLYTVNGHFPALRHIHDVRHGHPDVLFRLLTSLAGALTTFSLKIQPRDLPLYDHENLSGCFTDLDEKLRELLETVVPSNFVSLPLKFVKTSIYATNIEDDRYLTGTKFYLAVSSSMNQGDLIKKAPQLIKVCSQAQIEQLVRQALPGMQLTHAARPPASIPVKLNYQYFSLNQSGIAWEAVTKGRSLAAFVPNDIPEPQLELLILLPQAI
ncbi:MAG TPA: type VI secretion system baseplate subunit TssK [Candidatus Methylomirabilis sp.]|nr:type VI secretion system baseplate subunit TssK [Candidatus Methylomirabilis sp.]